MIINNLCTILTTSDTPITQKTLLAWSIKRQTASKIADSNPVEPQALLINFFCQFITLLQLAAPPNYSVRKTHLFAMDE